jgi:regulator of sigma E protease
MSIAAILIIGNALIVCHELGHYLAARSVGLVAERFTVGFGPNLLRLIDRRGTIGSLSALPLGGFVSFAGERDRGRAGGYAALRPTARMFILLAGPTANLLVAIGLCAFIVTDASHPPRGAV